MDARISPEYRARLNRVLDHIDAHLGEELSVASLAEVACFSPFHFHRMFSAVLGEPVGRYVQRLRLEHAAVWLATRPGASVTEIALEAGFGSSATFARAFREQFGVTATAWRTRSGRMPGNIDSNPGKAQRNAGQDFFAVSPYVEGNALKWRLEMKKDTAIKADVDVRDLAPRPVAYLRRVGPYQGDGALFGRLWNSLLQWAVPRGLFRPPETEMLCVYHDDPGITEAARLRLSVCITVPATTQPDGAIGRMTVAGGRYAVARFRLANDEYGAAWEAMYGGWLPQSGYQPDDRPAFEAYPGGGPDEPGRQVVDVYVPVRPL
jgi:AraC family transcriptional regulator